MSKTRALAAAGLFIIAACGQSAGVTLRYHFKPGQVFKYKTMMTGAGEMTGGPAQPMQMTLESSSVTTHKVRDVDKDGTATLDVETSDGSIKITMGGQEQNKPFPTQKMTFKVTPLGKFTAVGEQPKAPSQLGGELDMSGVLGAMGFPEKDLKTGDSWSGEAKFTIPVMGEVVLKFTQTLKGMEKLRGRDCAVIGFTFEAPLTMQHMGMSASGKMAGSGTTHFDVKNGVDVQTIGQIDQMMTVSGSAGGQSISMKQAMKMNMKQLLVE
jgi:hypothetical protein